MYKLLISFHVLSLTEKIKNNKDSFVKIYKKMKTHQFKLRPKYLKKENLSRLNTLLVYNITFCRYLKFCDSHQLPKFLVLKSRSFIPVKNENIIFFYFEALVLFLNISNDKICSFIPVNQKRHLSDSFLQYEHTHTKILVVGFHAQLEPKAQVHNKCQAEN